MDKEHNIVCYLKKKKIKKNSLIEKQKKNHQTLMHTFFYTCNLSMFKFNSKNNNNNNNKNGKQHMQNVAESIYNDSTQL